MHILGAINVWGQCGITCVDFVMNAIPKILSLNMFIVVAHLDVSKECSDVRTTQVIIALMKKSPSRPTKSVKSMKIWRKKKHHIINNH